MHSLRFPLLKFSSTLPCCFYELSTQWLWEESTIPVIVGSYRLVPGQRASLETVPPARDRQSSGGQNELKPWLFLPNQIHGTSSSTPMWQYNRLALAVTWNLIFWRLQREAFLYGFSKSDPQLFSAKTVSNLREKPAFCLFSNDSMHSWQLERNGPRKTQKTRFQVW